MRLGCVGMLLRMSGGVYIYLSRWCVVTSKVAKSGEAGLGLGRVSRERDDPGRGPVIADSPVTSPEVRKQTIIFI